MGLIRNILFPVSFSSSCVAMGAYVRRAAMMLGARVSMIHVVDPSTFSGMQLYLRNRAEVEDDYLEVAREKLNAFLAAEFPIGECSRIVAEGEPASEIATAARNGFDLIMMPTHAGRFRRMLLGSTTAKVLNDADIPVVTSRHVEEIAPRPLDHREWLCAVGLGEVSERVLRFANQIAKDADSHMRIIHAIQGPDRSLPIELQLEEEIHSEERQEARRQIEELQRRVGSNAPIRIALGSLKEALLEAARQSDADVVIIGRSPQAGSEGRLRDLTYAVVRDSPYPVVSV